jgi:hypothetical protein
VKDEVEAFCEKTDGLMVELEATEPGTMQEVNEGLDQDLRDYKTSTKKGN